jgi:RNA polymerase sigma factor (TIGR02999 family)
MRMGQSAFRSFVFREIAVEPNSRIVQNPSCSRQLISLQSPDRGVHVNPATPDCGVSEVPERLSSDELFPLVYDHLRRVARQHLQRSSPGQTLDATGLVHEAWLKLQKSQHSGNWNDQRHFYAVATAAMWQVLVDRARRRKSVRHGGAMRRHRADDRLVADDGGFDELLHLDAALQKLSAESPELGEIVRLRFFAALTYDEIAKLLQCSVACVRRQWTLAKTLMRSWIED